MGTIYLIVIIMWYDLVGVVHKLINGIVCVRRGARRPALCAADAVLLLLIVSTLVFTICDG